VVPSTRRRTRRWRRRRASRFARAVSIYRSFRV
jgi:hypothetical protein